jgi:nicotinamide riboside kinase
MLNEPLSAEPMTRINLYGGPGVGKSTLAARIFTLLKSRGANAELVQEFVKQYVYSGRQIRAWDYVYTFARQFEAEHRLLKGGVEILVTDSPLLLQCIYARRHRCPVYEQLFDIALEFEKEFPAVNFLVNRSVGFQPSGRWETDHEAREMDNIIRATLITRNVRFQEIDPRAHTDLSQLLGDDFV